MKKYVIPFVALAILVTASGFAGATHVSAGYISRDGDINFTLGGRYDLGRGLPVEVPPAAGHDVAASSWLSTGAQSRPALCSKAG